jgi:hypothetical protein
MAGQCKRTVACEELCVPPVITFSASEGKPEKGNGTKIFEEGIDRCRTRDEEAQGWYAEERRFGPEGHEPQAGDCDRTVGGEGQGQEGAEEGLEEAENGFEEKDGEEVEALGDAVGALDHRTPSCPGFVPGIHVFCAVRK